MQALTRHPSSLLAHSAAAQNMDASPAHSLRMEERHTLSLTRVKQDK